MPPRGCAWVRMARPPGGGVDVTERARAAGGGLARALAASRRERVEFGVAELGAMGMRNGLLAAPSLART